MTHTTTNTIDTTVQPCPSVVRKTTPKLPHIRREPIFLTDVDGVPIVLVRTNRSGMTVTVLAEDFYRLRGLGFTDQWSSLTATNAGLHYVVLHVTGLKGGRLWVARLISEAPRGTRVTYADGNRMNLRRENLLISRGYSKGREKSGIAIAVWRMKEKGVAVQ